jgi:Bacteriophage T4-like capsid assembly protein (Gp20).
MAERDIFQRLKRLFSTNTIVRNIGGRKLKVVDTGNLQSNVQTNLVDRYQKLYSNASQVQQYGYNDQLYQQQMRLGLFRDYESMDTDSIVASALDIYSDESTMKNEYGNVLSIETDNNQIHDILHNLFYDVINIEFNLWPWIRNMNKYGDFFLQLEVADKYGIINVTPMSAYDIARLEGHDPENPQNVQFVLTPNTDTNKHTHSTKQDLTFENYEVAHFRLLSDANYVPYGRSMLEAGRKVWKQLTLMEDAMLIHRIMRAPEKRIFKLDIGNIPPAEVDNYMQQVVNKMKKAPVIDEKTR